MTNLVLYRVTSVGDITALSLHNDSVLNRKQLLGRRCAFVGCTPSRYLNPAVPERIFFCHVSVGLRV